MKKPVIIWLLAMLGIITLLVVASGCSGGPAGAEVPPDPFTAVWGPGTDHIVTFSGDSAGHKAGEKSVFTLKLRNNANDRWEGEYLVQLLDKNSIVQEIARDTFRVSSGLEPVIQIEVTWNEDLDGPYGLSLYVPVRGAQSITTIWIGEKGGQAAGPWPSLSSHPHLWPEMTQVTEEEARQEAEEFVRNSATFTFDGMEETLELTETLYPDKENAWQFVFSFDSRHAGYGDRIGQMLAQVITPHEAVVTFENGRIVNAVMDGVWDMISQETIGEDIVIEPAPIHEVDIVIMESYPEQIGVNIELGLKDGCTTFHDAVVTREGHTVNIAVTAQRPADAVCTQEYSYYTKNLNLGSDFERGVTYTLNVNDYTTTFTYPD